MVHPHPLPHVLQSEPPVCIVGIKQEGTRGNRKARQWVGLVT